MADEGQTGRGDERGPGDSSGAPGESGSQGSPIEDEFTGLQRAGQDDPAAMTALWGAVYSLDRWYFMPAPPQAGAEDGPPGAYIGVIQGRPFLLAFTSAERVLRAARETKLYPEDAEVEPLWKEREPAAEWICSISDPIEGVLFNLSGGQGFFSTVDNIALMYDQVRDEMPAGCFDAFVRALGSAGRSLLWTRLHRRLVLMETWHFIGTEDRPSTPSLIAYKDKNYALLFTDQAHLGRAMEAGALQGPQPTLIPASPEQSMPLLGKLHADGKVAGVMVNYGTQAAVVGFEALEAAMNEAAGSE